MLKERQLRMRVNSSFPSVSQYHSKLMAVPVCMNSEYTALKLAALLCQPVLQS